MSEGISGRASGGQLEEKLDLTAETDAKIQQAEQLVLTNPSQLPEALALLAALEKRCRVGNDNTSLVKVCETSLKLCHQLQDEEALLSTLHSLATKRAQKTAAVRALVHTAMPWCMIEPYEPLALTQPSQIQFRNQLVRALRDITEGKLFLEKERAQLTRVLSAIQVRALQYSTEARTSFSLSLTHKHLYIYRKPKVTLRRRRISYRRCTSKPTDRSPKRTRSSSSSNK